MTTKDNAVTRAAEVKPAEVEWARVAAPLDVFENDDEFLLVADLPGVRSEDLHLRLDSGKLEIIGHEALPEGINRPPLAFTRTLQLPDCIDNAAVTADVKGGVLAVHLPKAASAKPRRIQVTGG